MATVNHILQQKDPHVWTIAPDKKIYAALAMLAEKNIGALPVVADGQLVGIFSERDYARKVALRGLASRDATVAEVMTRDVVCIQPNKTTQDCMTLMTDKRFRHLPVVDETNSLIGIISIGDVVKAVITEQQALIGHLEAYITGYRGV